MSLIFSRVPNARADFRDGLVAGRIILQARRVLERRGDERRACVQQPLQFRCHFRQHHAICERLAAADPSNAECQHSLSVALGLLGDLATTQGDLPTAARHFTECHAILARLAAADPTNARWQHSLSLALGKLGKLATAQGDVPATERYFREGLAIAEHLAAADPANAQWQREFAAVSANLGILAIKQGDLAAASQHLTESNAIFGRLVAIDPSNAEWQNDLLSNRQILAQIRALLALTSEFLPEVVAPSPSTPPPAPPHDPAPAALALLKAGKAQEALDKLRPFLFPADVVDMDHRKPLLARLAFLHALWNTENVDAVLRHLSYLPEQDDPRVGAIHRALAEWRQGFGFLQKLGLGSKPPLPPLPPLDDEAS